MNHIEQGRIEAGCDEAGRGCLAGPVVAAAVILPENFYHEKLTDSKKLTASLRLELRTYILTHALDYQVAFVDNQYIDKHNILEAAFTAMHQAVKGLSTKPQCLLIDGNRFRPFEGIPHECIVKGDSIYAPIAAASILAKTYRDEYMIQLSKKYPMYHWHSNMGYPTKLHFEGIKQHGTTPFHRMSFLKKHRLRQQHV